MEKVTSFKTSDGKLFEDKVSALQNEFQIELKGIFNGGLTGASNTFTTVQAAQIIAAKSEQFSDIVRKYREKIRRAATISPAKV